MIEYVKQKIGDLMCIHAARRDATATPDAVVILCHGFGASGTDLVPIADELLSNSERLANVRFIFPAAPIELDPNLDSRAWWMIDMERIQQMMLRGELREMRNESPKPLHQRRVEIEQIIRFAQTQFDIAAKRIIIGGFSQGAMLSTEVALKYAEPLGGVIVWSGSLINEKEWRPAAEMRSPLDIVQSHGRQDPILPFSGAEYLRDLFMSTNHRLNFLEFDGQHAIPAESIIAAQELIERVALG